MSCQDNNSVRIAHQDGILNASGCGVELLSGAPGATVLVAPQEQALHFAPAGAARVSSCQRNTPAGAGTDTTYQWSDARGWELEWTVFQLEKLPGCSLRARFYNRSDQPIRLREIALCETAPGGLSVEGDPADWLLSSLKGIRRTGTLAEQMESLNEYTTQMWAGFGQPLPHPLPTDEKHTDGRWRTFADWLTLYTDQGQKGLACGAVGPAEADVRFDCHVDTGAVRLSIISEMTDVIVEPGQSRRSEEVLLLFGPYAESVETIMRWTAATHGSRTHRGPISGWCSWYDLGPKITAKAVIEVSQAVAAYRDRIPMKVIQIDSGFCRTAGDWRCNEQFPEGWQPVVDAIESAEAIPGIWFAPLAVHDSLGHLEAHPDWFQRDEDGNIKGSIDHWGPTSHWLDPTHPEVQAFIRQIIRDARAAGFRYFKIDFNTVDGRMYNPQKTRLQAFRDLYKLYREELGEDCYLLACAGLFRGTVGYADAARVGTDSGASWVAPHPCTIRNAIRDIGTCTRANRILFANDPDVTYTLPRNTLTENERRTWHSFVGLLGGLNMISEPLQKTDYQQALRMLEILIPPSPECGHALYPGVDIEDRRFGFVAERPWGSFAAVLLYNPEERPTDVSLDMARLALPGDRYHIWSFWDEAYLGIGSGTLTSPELPAHAPALLRLTPATEPGLPAVVGSNLHLSMGAAELEDIWSTPDQMTIVLLDGGARQGALWIAWDHMPQIDTCTGCTVSGIAAVAPGIYKLGISSRTRGEKQTISLTKEAS